MKLLHLLFPQVRAEVLRLLFTDADREVHGRDLARQSGLNVKTVQDELGKMSTADLVTSRRDGNRRYFRANASHPLFVDLQQIVLKTAGLKEIVGSALAPIEGAEIAFIFGSLANGMGKAASDVDLLVIGDVGLRKLAGPLRSAGHVLGREIKPIIRTAAEFKRGRRKDPFLADVLAKPKLFVKGDAHELERLG